MNEKHQLEWDAICFPLTNSHCVCIAYLLPCTWEKLHNITSCIKHLQLRGCLSCPEWNWEVMQDIGHAKYNQTCFMVNISGWSGWKALNYQTNLSDRYQLYISCKINIEMSFIMLTLPLHSQSGPESSAYTSFPNGWKIWLCYNCGPYITLRVYETIRSIYFYDWWQL